jgi:hypothetical protein
MNWMKKILRRTDNNSRNQDTNEQPPDGLKLDRSGKSVIGDNPIRTSEDDALGRTKGARSLAVQILSLDIRGYPETL